MMDKWEYKIVRLGGLGGRSFGAAERAEKGLNRLASEGWRLAGIWGGYAVMERSGESRRRRTLVDARH